MKYNVTIDDVSPIVQYGDGWTDALPSGVASPSYKGDSYHATNLNVGSFASFAFTGTSIAVYGSKGLDHGEVTVTLDGVDHILDGFSAVNAYQISNFVQDPARPWLYLDYFEFETGQDDDVANASFNIDDSNSTISYAPPEAWGSTAPDLDMYYNGTVHTSKFPGATASTSFQGNAISIFGAVSPKYGSLEVTIDGNATTTINCSASAFRPQTLLFYSNEFVSGVHSLSMRIPSNLSPAPIDFDFITITQWSDNNGPGNGKALTPIIAGSICGALVLLAWLTYLSHWYYLRRKKRKGMNAEMLRASDMLALRAQKKTPTGVTSPPSESHNEPT